MMSMSSYKESISASFSLLRLVTVTLVLPLSSLEIVTFGLFHNKTFEIVFLAIFDIVIVASSIVVTLFS